MDGQAAEHKLFPVLLRRWSFFFLGQLSGAELLPFAIFRVQNRESENTSFLLYQFPTYLAASS